MCKPRHAVGSNGSLQIFVFLLPDRTNQNNNMQQHLSILATAFADVRMSHPYLAYLLAFAFIIGCLKVLSWLKTLFGFLILKRFFSPSNLRKFIKKGESWAGMLQYPVDRINYQRW